MIRFTDMEVVGMIPMFLNESDSRSASQQINAAYQHGGGWRNFKGHKLTGNEAIEGKDAPYALEYPGDPPMHELSRAKLHNETLVFFESSWLAIIQEDGAFEVSRID